MARLENSVKKSVVSLLAVSFLFLSFSAVSTITVHPAVFKNFVGPFRVHHSAPVLRSDIPFNWEENGVNVLENENDVSREIVSEPRPVALKIRDVEEIESDRAIRTCRGSAPCRRNLDSTLNLLMRMMETGR